MGLVTSLVKKSLRGTQLQVLDLRLQYLLATVSFDFGTLASASEEIPFQPLSTVHDAQVP